MPEVHDEIDFKVRPTLNGVPLSGDTLPEDTYAEADPITDWPEGISEMGISAAANWDGWATDGLVVTYRTGSFGWQQLSVPDGGGGRSLQWRDYSSVDGWYDWLYAIDFEGLNDAIEAHADGFAHKRLLLLGLDAHAESTAISPYASGISIMPVSSGANWGPNAGEAGHVIIEQNDQTNTGKQTFVVPSTSTSYVRYYTSGAWSSWAAFSMEGHTHANAAASGAAGFLTGSDKAKLDGIESGASADQTPSEILSALLSVDGSGSLLDADKLDNLDSSAFVQTTRAISTTAPLSGGGDLSANRTLAVSTATETAEGVSERATQAETDAGTDDVRYLSALKLASTPRLPTQGENDALVGTSGAASSTNKYVTDADSRNTNARTPTSHATSHVTGGSDVIANAVASGNSGLLSGSDKAKLDGIESGATADQTGSEILSALLTVDGAASLLDSDKLDGQEGSYYTNASNLASGTVPTARQGSGAANSTTFLRGDQTWAAPPGAPTTGTATLDFGAFPGADDTSVAVSGQSSIVSGSVVEAWLRLVATSDHSADEHLIESIRVMAGNIVAGTGFTIYGINANDLQDPAGTTPMIQGQWSVAWRWS